MCRARRRGPRTPTRTTDANLDCAFVENAIVFVLLNIGAILFTASGQSAYGESLGRAALYFTCQTKYIWFKIFKL